MNKMFYNCKKLKSIKFPEEKKISGLNMRNLFLNCSSLTSLDLSSFDTSNVIYMENMFNGCTKLESLDISNFNTNSLTNMFGMFKECSSLIYLNMKSVVIDSLINTNYIFSGCSDKLILCCEKEYESKLTRDLKLTNNCSDICFSDTKKIIIELNKCVEDCNTDNSEYKYEYNNKCYKECPEGTISSSSDEFLCIETDCVYYNINKTECFENLPEGYYIFNKEKKIIDKCHKNCKTCDKKEDENNNNCITCKNDYFFEEGNCVSKCTYNSYIDENGNNICTCSSNIKCKECSDESLKSDSCISCNNESGFYPSYYESLNQYFKDCYNNISGHYLKDNIFYPCFSFCFSCSKGGGLFEHNCDECKSGYTF
jgi:surface protein